MSTTPRRRRPRPPRRRRGGGAPTSLSAWPRGDQGEVGGAPLLQELGEEHRLEEQVAQLVGAGPRRPGPRRRPPRTPPRSCAGRSSRRSARGPTGTPASAGGPPPRGRRPRPRSRGPAAPRGRAGWSRPAAASAMRWASASGAADGGVGREARSAPARPGSPEGPRAAPGRAGAPAPETRPRAAATAVAGHRVGGSRPEADDPNHAGTLRRGGGGRRRGGGGRRRGRGRRLQALVGVDRAGVPLLQHALAPVRRTPAAASGRAGWR